MGELIRGGKEEVLTKEQLKTKEPPMYRVVLLNDHYTTMEFVVLILERVFNKTAGDAQQVMLAVHNQGRGTAGVYTKEVAETKIAITHQFARQNEFPLKCSMEPV